MSVSVLPASIYVLYMCALTSEDKTGSGKPRLKSKKIISNHLRAETEPESSARSANDFSC